MSTDYESESFESDIDDENDKEFDKQWEQDELMMKEFIENSKNYAFQLLTVPVFRQIMNGTYKPEIKNNNDNSDDEIVFPDSTQIYFKPKTHEEILQEKKSWVVLTNEGPKPLYPQLHKIKIIKKTPPPPPPKTIMEKITDDKKLKLKETGNSWGKIKKKKINLDQIQKQMQIDIEKEIKKKEIKKKEMELKKQQEEKIRLEQRNRNNSRNNYSRNNYRNRNRNNSNKPKINKFKLKTSRFSNPW